MNSNIQITNKIKFKHLSTPLKIAVVFSWILFGVFIFGFTLGIFEGLLILGGY